ncbi:S24/S26 family peptidase [Metallosphaera hakonensis]|uniref:S24/S26 family peptidase n=1 Tax=Metallosphaera hakonensis TaxID=79601 RepID=UPI000B11BA6A|nr:S24/S26 family peptidase [Metallosphaera hakonensis]
MDNPLLLAVWEYVKPVLNVLFKLLLIIILVFSIAVVSANLDGRPLFVAFTNGYSMYPFLKPGELVLIVPEPLAGKIDVGNIVVFHDPDYGKIPGYPPYIIHQVVNITKGGLITKGINDNYVDQLYMPPVTNGQIYGKLLVVDGNPVVVPGIGSLVYYLENDSLEGVMVLTVIGVAFLVLDSSLDRRKRRREINISTRGVMIGIGIIIVSFTVISSLAMSFSATFSYFAASGPVEVAGGAINTPSINLGVLTPGKTGTYVINVSNKIMLPEYVEISSVRSSSTAYYNVTPTSAILMPSQTLHLKFTAINNGSKGLNLVVVKAFVIPTLFPLTALEAQFSNFPLALLLISALLSTLPFILFIYLLRLKKR